MNRNLFFASIVRTHGIEIGHHGGATLLIAYAGKDIGEVTLHANEDGVLYAAGDSVDFWCSPEIQEWRDANFDDVAWRDVREAIVDAANVAWLAR